MPDQISKEVVQERFERLLAVANNIAWEENQKQIGNVVEVLVANDGRKDDATGRLTGRARDNRLVHFTLPDGVKAPRPGDIVTVTVSEAGPYHLIADPKTSAEITVRRTIGGDAFERLNEEAETKRIALSITPAK